MTAEGHPHDPPCTKCGQAHFTKKGKPACHGHIYNSDPPVPCKAQPYDREFGTLCGMHGGKAFHVRNASQRRRGLAAIKTELDSLGCDVDVEPAEAMIIMVRESAANVVYLRSLVQELSGKVGSEGPVVIDEDGVARVDPAWVGDGIAQRTDPDTWKSETHVLVRMYNEERERLVRFSKLCRDAGVDERMLQIAEQQGEWLVTTLDRVLEHLELTDEQRGKLPAIMGRVVSEIEAGNA